ncbi:DMT family transporter [Rhodoferax saidenbachensis]|uniref:EamA family transporter n=1 Tax=Rhodoferax saidenbachensis TaxID=1484693 RepID=A0A1P8K5D2_9BURK|nr:DMT family transporter [Rhodoferax saidenbachensis]APW41202.1 EamA family transporter [Rhodoferax saidenbachensis]
MDTRKALDSQAIGCMLVLCALWALQQVTLKATAQDIAPIFLIGLRSGVAAFLVWLVMLWRGERLGLHDGSWRPGLLVGLLFGLEFMLVGEGLRHTSASHMVVFLYTAPIFAALGLHWRLPAERLGVVQWLGIALAFGGITMAFFGRTQPTAPAPGNMLWGDFLGLLGGMAWGATTMVVRCSRLSSAPATQTLLYQLVCACVLLLGAALFTGQTNIHFTPQVWANLAFHTLVVSFASFLVWFWLLRHYLASRLGVFSFMTPLFGIVFGAWFLDEPIEMSFVLGAVPVLFGIVLVSGGASVTQWWARLRLQMG